MKLLLVCQCCFSKCMLRLAINLSKSSFWFKFSSEISNKAKERQSWDSEAEMNALKLKGKKKKTQRSLWFAVRLQIKRVNTAMLKMHKHSLESHWNLGQGFSSAWGSHYVNQGESVLLQEPGGEYFWTSIMKPGRLLHNQQQLHYRLIKRSRKPLLSWNC